MNPTDELYRSLETAYDFFNEQLFEGSLPKVIFTVQRKAGITGYFAADRWGNQQGEKRSELAINPSYLANSRLVEVCQTLVHEMVHCWQFHFGKPGRKGYHNKEWAYKMIAVGLMPSSTGEPGGEIVGQHMSDYIIEEGGFIQAYQHFTTSFSYHLPWVDRHSLPRLYKPVVAPLVGEKAQLDSSSEMPLVKTHEESIQLANDLDSVNQNPIYSAQIFGNPIAESFPENFVYQAKPQKPTRLKYMCHGCGAKVYGKPNLNISCDDCGRTFLSS